MKQQELEFYYAVVTAASQMSYCARLRVGAIVIDESNQSIISYGYNGTPPGEENVCEGVDGKTLPAVQHAERNALRKVMRSNASSVGKTMICTHAPCENCAIDIHMAGISRLIYVNEYKPEGIEYLRRKGILVEKIDVES